MRISDNINKQNKGFTIAEVLVASLIALITALAILSLYIFSWRSFATGNVLLDVYLNSRNASGYLTQDIRCAAQVVQSHGSYTTTDNSIVLQVPAINSSGYAISPNCDYIIYRLQGSDLYRIVEKDAASSRLNENRVIARYCTSLTFSSGGVTLSNIGDLSTINTVAIYLPINKSTVSTSGSGTENESINPTTIVKLRNKW